MRLYTLYVTFFRKEIMKKKNLCQKYSNFLLVLEFIDEC